MWMLHGSVLSPFVFAVVVDIAIELATQGVLSKLLYADDLVLISETIEGLGNKLMKWKVFESNGLKVSFGK